MLLAVMGIFGGANLAVFTMGIFIPIVNHKGALIGSICGTGRLPTL